MKPENQYIMAADRQNHSESVQERILAAAELLFSQNGFRGTPVRDITKVADCNLAAVNYHFGGKENLYHEVFRRRMVLLRDTRINSMREVMARTDPPPVLEDLLYAFATSFLEPLMDENAGRFLRILSQEMVDPHLPKQVFMKGVIEPVTNVWFEAMNQICPEADQETVTMAAHLIVGQLVQVLRIRIWSQQEMADGNFLMMAPVKDLKHTVDLIVRFSAAGIRAMIQEEQDNG